MPQILFIEQTNYLEYTIVIDAFDEWIVTNSDDFKRRGLQYEVTKSPLDISKPSVRVDFDNDKYLSRITVWATGECKMEAIEAETEQTVLDKYVTIESNSDFEQYFSELLKKIDK